MVRYSLLLLLVSFVCLSPLILSLSFRIWPPTAMVHEVFGTYFFHFNFLSAPYIIETGYGALASLAYLPSVLINSFFAESDIFRKMLIFSYGFYSLSGAVLILLFTRLMRLNVGLHDLLMLLMVVATPALLERETNFGLMINYDRAQVIVLIATGWLFLIGRLENQPSPRHAVFIGLLAGYACSVKFSNLVAFVPFIVCLLIGRHLDYRSLAKSIGIAAVSGIVAFAVVMVIYSKFSLATLAQFPVKLGQLYGGAWLNQRTPFVFSELTRVDGGSYYLSLQLAGLILLLLYPAALFIAAKSRCLRSIALMAAIPVSFAALALILSKRVAQGTMIDISLVTVFSIFLCVSMLLKTWTRAAAARLSAVCLFIFVVAAMAAARPVAVLTALAHNSAEAAAINNLMNGDKSRPIVYYMYGMAQPILFPSPEQICGYKASDAAMIGKGCPRYRIVDPQTNLPMTPQYAVFPEYIDTLPETAELKREWPEYWRKISFLDTGRWQTALAGRECHKFNFTEPQSRDHLVYFSAYATVVTVCII